MAVVHQTATVVAVMMIAIPIEVVLVAEVIASLCARGMVGIGTMTETETGIETVTETVTESATVTEIETESARARGTVTETEIEIVTGIGIAVIGILHTAKTTTHANEDMMARCMKTHGVGEGISPKFANSRSSEAAWNRRRKEVERNVV